MTDTKPHSAAVLNDVRDYWWSPDFIELMAKRLTLNRVKSMLDIGCGMGHWGQLLAPHLAPDAKLAGIDPEAAWVEQATARAQQKGFGDRSHYQVASAEVLPYEDNHFDMVTCQTVLIHVKDISTAIREMLRVLKPGGLLLVAEPNNLASQLIFNNLTFDNSIDTILDQIRFSLICERGREALGRGNAYRGDIIPSYFHKANLDNIQVFLSDLADYFIPPYESPRERISLAELYHDSADSWLEVETELKNLFLAGGGTLLEFVKYWQITTENKDQIINGYKEKSLCSPGGLVMYLISGSKPSA